MKLWHGGAILGLALGALGAAATVRAQQPPALDAAQLRVELEKLNVVGSALYIGAHPDDENTALLAYLSQGRKVRAAYLSLTRGDGGQNLIGTEQGELLGAIRTEELLAARRIDGAEQFFTRAIDFGYSKTPEETLRIWGHDAVLADVVWVIRSFRPDVIITRFPANGDGGHGHHTASAILSAEAFAAAADPNRFPEQLKLVAPWQAKRLMWNAWRRPGETPPSPPPAQIEVDLGAYDPLLGRSYAEIAAVARTMHKSQGFGSSLRRGSLPNAFELVAGAPATSDLFDGVDLTWKRIRGSEAVASLLARAAAEYRETRPSSVVPTLVDALDALDRLGGDPSVVEKRAEVLDAIRVAAGVWVEAIAADATATPGGTLKVAVSALNRSELPLALARLEIPGATSLPALDVPLPRNQAVSRDLTVTIPRDAAVSQPYWLAGAHVNGTYTVPEQPLVGAPHDRPALAATIVLRLGARELAYTVPVVYRWTDPVNGERIRDISIVPKVTVNFEAPVLVFGNHAARKVRVTARAYEAKTNASIHLRAPAGWRVDPADVAVAFEKRGESRSLAFTITPASEEGRGDLVASVTTDREEKGRGVVEIDHPHIPSRTLLPPAVAKLVRVDIVRPVKRIGYIMGPGDEIPAMMRQLGLEVALLGDDELDNGELATFDAIVVGARAYNTRERLAAAQDHLLAYVHDGGTLVVQYNVDRGLVTDKLAPYPLTLSRDRVTDENATVTVLAPGHPLLSRPHAIVPADFAGWIQERGLYYPSKWDSQYAPILSMADPGEPPTNGALLFAHYGKGAYIYTGLAFFRQIPAGVPGALRLFVNLLAGGKPGA